jgi:hypothetical protein
MSGADRSANPETTKPVARTWGRGIPITDAQRAAIQPRVLAGVSSGLTIGDACKAVGINRSVIDRWRKDDVAFGAAFKAAFDDGSDKLEAEAQRRAVEGTDKPVFHKGQVCGHVREYSDTLLIFLLKSRNPERFRDNVRVEHSGTVEHKHVLELCTRYLANADARRAALVGNG